MYNDVRYNNEMKEKTHTRSNTHSSSSFLNQQPIRSIQDITHTNKKKISSHNIIIIKMRKKL